MVGYETVAEIAQRLGAKIGLIDIPVASGWVRDGVAKRMQALAGESEVAYLNLLRRDAGEWAQLVSAVTVNRTWFFREAASTFKALGALTRQRVASKAPGPWRILSVPCSTGEEPYSIAMALLEAGLPLSGFRIDALDVDREALAFARQRTYERRSFIEMPPGLIERYFARQGARWKLFPAVAKSVRFAAGNLSKPDCLREASFDVIFCRNVMCYLSVAARQVAIENVKRALAPGGVCFAAATEAHCFREAGFEMPGTGGGAMKPG